MSHTEVVKSVEREVLGLLDSIDVIEAITIVRKVGNNLQDKVKEGNIDMNQQLSVQEINSEFWDILCTAYENLTEENKQEMKEEMKILEND